MTTTMKEEEIRPQDLFNRFLAAAREDIGTFFADPSRFVTTDCAGCGSARRERAFDKLGIEHRSELVRLAIKLNILDDFDR